MQTVYLDPEFNKRLEILRRSGKKGLIAATKAEEIVNRMQSGNVRLRRAGTMTKHGEARIKGVMKYDLGSGYRLITYKQDDSCYMLFIGTHDECHRWIENNREFDIRQVEGRCALLPIHWQEAPQENDVNPTEWEIKSEADDDPLLDIGEKDLRVIFSGLTNT